LGRGCTRGARAESLVGRGGGGVRAESRWSCAASGAAAARRTAAKAASESRDAEGRTSWLLETGIRACSGGMLRATGCIQCAERMGREGAVRKSGTRLMTVGLPSAILFPHWNSMTLFILPLDPVDAGRKNVDVC
jgi:hypothetical protein